MALPSINLQKSFIINNASILNKGIQQTILSLVMMEIGPTIMIDGETCAVVSDTGLPAEANIDLDLVDTISPDDLAHIYNIVLARRKILNEPAI